MYRMQSRERYEMIVSISMWLKASTTASAVCRWGVLDMLYGGFRQPKHESGICMTFYSSLDSSKDYRCNENMVGLTDEKERGWGNAIEGIALTSDRPKKSPAKMLVGNFHSHECNCRFLRRGQ